MPSPGFGGTGGTRTHRGGDSRTIIIDTDDVSQVAGILQDIFQRLETRANELSFQDVFQREAFPALEKTESQFFASESSPSGSAWPALAASTVRRKGHDIILVESGRLRESLVGTTGDSIRDAYDLGLAFGTTVEYGIFHQDGTATLPQREFLGFSEPVLDYICNMIADVAVEQITAAW